MAKPLIKRSNADIKAIKRMGDHRDGRRAAWFAIRQGSKVIVDIQRLASTKKKWVRMKNAYRYLNPQAKRILEMREEAIHWLKRAPHHEDGFRMSRHTGTRNPRGVAALCLISGHVGQEISGLVAYDRVLVDAEHMEQALGPATVDEIFNIRKLVGERVCISTNVSETPQIVRNLKTGGVDSRATSALTASKVIAALNAGADIVKVGFAHADFAKRDLRSQEVIRQMKFVRDYVDRAVKELTIIMPLNPARRYPLVSVFFPEIGIDSNGERPMEIAKKAIDLTAEGGWQGVLIDTFEKFTGKAYRDFYCVDETEALARRAHEKKLEFWIAGSIAREEIAPLLRCKVDLICFGGAARHRSGKRTTYEKGKKDESIKRPLVEELVHEFECADPRPDGSKWPYDPVAAPAGK